ncbi:MAG: TonB-dependent receptor [Cyclobacteriaceae bacterium]|nr:TonB-dependent receptor [Cyclobacteriaceae bacterium]MCH8515134.1 TonB-dependent receptor [Cyclobacteriaceae bacterium]
MKQTLQVLTVLLLCFHLVHAQETTISGTVYSLEDEESLPGVSVTVKGTTIGVTTNIDGQYSIDVPSDANVLVFTFVGMVKEEVRIGNRSTIDVYLSPNIEQLSEVVITGYGGQTSRKELTGASVRVDSKEITQRQVPRLDQALQGAVSGVSVTTNSGSPGGSSNIRIRGISTSGDNNPLIIVDGVIYDQAGLNALNPNDIESVNIMKDATAGIYGVRAANGVIIIETKKGKKNSKPQFRFDGYYGIQETSNQLDLLNASQYAILVNEAHLAGGRPLPFPNTQLGEGTDWQNEVFQQAPIQNYNFGMSGGSDKTTYDIGGSYFGQEGIVGGPKANFDRYNARINFTTELAPKLTFTNVMLFTHERTRTLPENGIGSVLYNTINAYPTEPLRQDDGRFSFLERVQDIINPLAQMENTFNQSIVNKITGKQELAYQINDHLKASGRIGYNYSMVDFDQFSPLAWFGPGKAPNTALNENLDPVQIAIGDPDEGGVLIDRGASVFESRTTFLDYVLEGFLNYDRTFNDVHNFSATFGVSFNEVTSRSLSGTAFNIPNNSIDLANVGANQAPGGFLNNVGGFRGIQRLYSQFLRAEYDYNKKYLFSSVIRRDGSTRFGPNNRFGYFGSGSAAWVISEESFFNSSVFDFVKLSASFGVVGNDRIGDFAWRGLLNGVGNYVFDGVIQQGVAIGRASNPDLRWETTQHTNLGVDFTMFSKIDASVNYFIKDTRDLLFVPDVSALLGSFGAGGFPPFVNAGTVRNQGLEVDLNFNLIERRDAGLSINYNFTYLRNEVLSGPDGFDFIPGSPFGVGGEIATRFQVGFPIGYFFGFETDGIFQNQAEIDNNPVTQPGARPGDLRFVDQSGDGRIDFGGDSDRTMIGSPIPDFIMGMNVNANYKGFDFSANIFASIGNDIVRNYERQQPFANRLEYRFDRWIGPNTSNEHPRETVGSTRNTVFSDYFVEDGSFVRLRNIQVGYTFPNRTTQYLGISNLRVYASSINLLTITGYKGFDPDIGGGGGPLSQGIDFGFYPQPRTFMGGLSLNF